MWELLTPSLLHYFRHEVVGDHPTGPGSLISEAERERAKVDLLNFAGLVERYLPPEMCTYNLHLLVCHLHRQEAERGNAAKDLELWVEGQVQRLKRGVKYMTTQWPEKLFVLSLLLDDALARAKVRSLTGGPLHDFNALLLAYRAKPLTRPGYDEGDPDSGSQLLGKAQKVSVVSCNTLKFFSKLQIRSARLQPYRPTSASFGPRAFPISHL